VCAKGREEGHQGKTQYLFTNFDKHLRSIAKLLIDYGHRSGGG